MSIFRMKSLSDTLEDAHKASLKKTLSYFDLVMIGIGAIIGTGIFVITGAVAAQYSGPGITLSFFIAGVVCVFTALAYAELASTIPVSGGAYTYSYIIFGELAGWIAGCCILMVCTFGAASVATGWSGYMIGILHSIGIDLPVMFTKIPSEGGLINLPAIIIALLIAAILVKGTKESATLNGILVALKIGIVLLFIFIAFPHFDSANFDPFMPFGFDGVATGAATVFIAYSGFDTVAMAAEECKNPKRDLPIGIIGSLLLCAVLYIIVSGMLTGIAPYHELNNTEPITYTLRKNGSNIGGALVAAGALAGMTTVLMMQIFGQSRVLFAMSRDGMIPKPFMNIHKKFETPYVGILITGLVTALISGFAPITTIGMLTSFSTLVAFIMVLAGVITLRIKQPELKRPFRCPIVFVIAPLAIIFCLYLLAQLIGASGIYFASIMAFGILTYIFYGYKNSSLAIEKA
jgi:basic amino acid/polyamine antiporter, APA family